MIKMQSSGEPCFTLDCKICKKEYQEDHSRTCFAFNMKFHCSENICIECRLFKAAKLECAIMELAKDSGLEICEGRRACTALMNKRILIGREEVLPDNLQKKLDGIPLAYPRNLKKDLRFMCPFPRNQGSELQGDASESGFVMINKNDKDTSECDYEVLNKSDENNVPVESLTGEKECDVVNKSNIQRFVIDDEVIEMYISGKLIGDMNPPKGENLN